MSRVRSPGESEWVYESIIRSVPGLNASRSVALAVQFVGFELAILGLSWYHGLPRAAIAGTVGVLVAVAGSAFMLRLASGIRDAETPEPYRHLLFGSRIELVLGLISFLILVVYVFIYDVRQPGQPLVTGLLGERPPLLFSFMLLMIGWDVAYRIGVGWWASVVGLWRSLYHSARLSSTVRGRFQRLDGLTIVFATVQILLVPLLSGHPLLQLAVLGHIVAVIIVSGASILVLRKRR